MITPTSQGVSMSYIDLGFCKISIIIGHILALGRSEFHPVSSFFVVAFTVGLFSMPLKGIANTKFATRHQCVYQLFILAIAVH